MTSRRAFLGVIAALSGCTAGAGDDTTTGTVRTTRTERNTITTKPTPDATTVGPDAARRGFGHEFAADEHGWSFRMVPPTVVRESDVAGAAPYAAGSVIATNTAREEQPAPPPIGVQYAAVTDGEVHPFVSEVPLPGDKTIAVTELDVPVDGEIAVPYKTTPRVSSGDSIEQSFVAPLPAGRDYGYTVSTALVGAATGVICVWH